MSTILRTEDVHSAIVQSDTYYVVYIRLVTDGKFRKVHINGYDAWINFLGEKCTVPITLLADIILISRRENAVNTAKSFTI